VTDSATFDYQATIDQAGPLTPQQAAAALNHASELMASADFAEALVLYRRVSGVDDAGLTCAAMVGAGEAFHRLNEEGHALREWETATRLPDNPFTYIAWRNVAGARVRLGDLDGAKMAYREADRLAPMEDKAEIASRLGWLSKELGDKRASGRYFARARGDVGFSFALAVIGVTSIVSLVVELAGPDGKALGELLALIKPLVADGELWRLWTVTLVHGGIMHLVLNMYALWLIGPFVERLYGRGWFLLLYLVTAAGGSLASFAFSDAPASVGASGAVFGLFGLLIAALFIHRPILSSQARGLMGQLVALVILNLVLGFTMGGIDNFAHIGGLVTGLWMGTLFGPTLVPTMKSMWLRPGPTPGTTQPAFGAANRLIQGIGVIALLAFLGVLWAQGMTVWA